MPMRPTPLTISPRRRPKVLLLGNGMNRVFGGGLLVGPAGEDQPEPDFTADQVKGIPFPMQAVLLSKDHVDVSLHDLQRELTHCEVHPWLSEQLQRLLAMPFDCILTPNFTYEIQCAVMPDFVDHAPRYLTHTSAVPLAERASCSTPIMICPWGSAPCPSSTSTARPACRTRSSWAIITMATCSSAATDYLTRRAPACRYPLWVGGGEMEALSWLDYFILGDVYSLGFGFDTSEMDLWWLLCRKKRERADHGELYFFRAGAQVRPHEKSPPGSLPSQVRDLGRFGTRGQRLSEFLRDGRARDRTAGAGLTKQAQDAIIKTERALLLAVSSS